MDFGKIKQVLLKDVWAGEATHFSPWLAQNLDVLSDKLGMDLELETTEGAAGDFSADIIARDLSTNRLVIIENQFGGTDHRHLGQIITYASVLDAGIVVWIAENIRPEHKTAIDFLNQNLKEGLQLYAVEASVIQIDESKPAFILNVVSIPTEASLIAAGGGQQLSETQEKYRAYFQELIDELRETHKFTNARVGQPQNWYTFTSENAKVFKYSISFANKGRVRAEVYIDCGDKTKNEQIFSCLLSKKNQIENDFGAPLTWEPLEAKRACRIAVYRDGDIDVESDVLADIKKWLIENLLRFKQVFPEHFRQCDPDNKSESPPPALA